MAEENMGEIVYFPGKSPREIEVTEMSYRGNTTFSDGKGRVVQGNGVRGPMAFKAVPGDASPEMRDKVEARMTAEGYGKVQSGIRCDADASAQVWALPRPLAEKLDAAKTAERRRRSGEAYAEVAQKEHAISHGSAQVTSTMTKSTKTIGGGNK